MVETQRTRPRVAKYGDDDEPQELEDLVLFPEFVEEPFEIVEIEFDGFSLAELDLNLPDYFIEETNFYPGNTQEDHTEKIRDILDTMGFTINCTLAEIFKANENVFPASTYQPQTRTAVNYDFEKGFDELKQMFERIETINGNMGFMFKLMVFLCFLNTLLILKMTMFDSVPDLGNVLSNLPY
ncbi:uncharacterized protein LOC109545339 [Dendroctonus ponderosae]|uniref:Uncharacterized protein n=1 Tax=Dendroctonus ponderosae TaxID=77166 RepID=U4U384_DENPD|nr:uncharacterized protein LOC109545339 [Dendroctonus ponderosae]XP_019771534.1 uncharacterized protein LOC109545339 [Dendroctonus ponderosae]XP_019771535.1 uncharacterized protein LOC109545339 [Dendroctonus ponderosae]ERL84440.1 hypothetical protein D910_01872 [Dendroctonus ponderosae]